MIKDDREKIAVDRSLFAGKDVSDKLDTRPRR
jgi:hypothetical protein